MHNLAPWGIFFSGYNQKERKKKDAQGDQVQKKTIKY